MAGYHCQRGKLRRLSWRSHKGKWPNRQECQFGVTWEGFGNAAVGTSDRKGNTYVGTSDRNGNAAGLAYLCADSKVKHATRYAQILN